MSNEYMVEFIVLIPGGYVAHIPARLHATQEGQHPFVRNGIKYIIVNPEKFLAIMDIQLIIYSSRQSHTGDNS